jgi:hypothetical protein
MALLKRKYKRASKAGANEENEGDDGTFHLFCLCLHEDIAGLQVDHRKDTGPMVIKFTRMLATGAKGSGYLTDDQKAELTKHVNAVVTLVDSGALKERTLDSNAVIFKLMTMQPFPPMLADLPGADLPLVKALGSVFHLTPAIRECFRSAAVLLFRWTSSWIGKFARRRLKALPAGHYGTRAEPKAMLEDQPESETDDDLDEVEGELDNDENPLEGNVDEAAAAEEA